MWVLRCLGGFYLILWDLFNPLCLSAFKHLVDWQHILVSVRETNFVILGLLAELILQERICPGIQQLFYGLFIVQFDSEH